MSMSDIADAVTTLGVLALIAIAVYAIATAETTYQEHYKLAEKEVKKMITSNSTYSDKLDYIEFSCKEYVEDIPRCMSELRHEFTYMDP